MNAQADSGGPREEPDGSTGQNVPPPDAGGQGEEPRRDTAPRREPRRGAAEEGAPRPEPEGLEEAQHVLWSRQTPRLWNSTLIAAFEGWNDAGSAATMAALHLAKRWGCETVAEIDPEPFYDFTSTRPTVHLDEQKNRYLKWPSNKIWTARIADAEADVAVLVGVEPQLRWRTFCKQVLRVAEMLDVGRVVALGALLAEIPHSRPVEVYGTADAGISQNEFQVSPSTYEGPTGIIGVLTTACRDAGYPTASFWAAVPSYTPGTPSPKAALALVSRTCSVVASTVKTTDLEQSARAYEQELAQLVEQNDETAEYVARLERKWDDRQARSGDVGRGVSDISDTPLEDDPKTLLAEVEQFLRETD